MSEILIGSLALAGMTLPSCAQDAAGAHVGAAGSDLRPAVPAPADVEPEENLPAIIAEAYSNNPGLASRRYDRRATDDDIGVALAQMRPTAQVQVSAGYELTRPGDITQAGRSLSDRLNSPDITRNDVTSQFVLDQPLWTGGRASSAVRAARSASQAGRETLREAEGDFLLDLIGAYADALRDTSALAIRRHNRLVLDAALQEIAARREAGELTRTDVAQAETQIQSAEVLLNLAEAQLQASRAAVAALVGREPGRLSPPPPLPNLPRDLEDAFTRAEQGNPDLAAAIAVERASRARIAVAKAEGAPQVSLRGTAGTSGPLSPFDRRDQDLSYTARATLTIPLTAGGRIRSQIAQAQNRNTADQLRIEVARRQVVQGLVNAWNQWATAERNILAGTAQLHAAETFYEGTYAEYREGLRSTFDVLYALNGQREAEIALLASHRDSYVARAGVLRRTGQLEVASLLVAPEIEDPGNYTRAAQRRGAVPWGGLLRGLDRLGAPVARASPPRLPPATRAPIAVPAAEPPPPGAVTSRVGRRSPPAAQKPRPGPAPTGGRP